MPQIIAHRFRQFEKTWREGRPAGDRKGSLDVWTTFEVFRQTDWQKLAGQIGK